MNPNNREVDDHRAYVENILKTHGEGKNPVSEGSIKGKLDDHEFECPADSWVEFTNKYGERLLLLFRSDDLRINLEVKQSALSSSTYVFDMGGGDFLYVLPGNDQPRWNADTAKFSSVYFDAGTGRLESDVEATLWRGYPPDQETARLKAKLFVVKPAK
ncbi:hypothetical protein [Pseudomonas sp. KCJK9016]|uniref:hypothetical protein n=1 Tax=Pseudomonas sp. KCJK9016 TaxID=3344556 RepID=UPI003906169F